MVGFGNNGSGDFGKKPEDENRNKKKPKPSMFGGTQGGKGEGEPFGGSMNEIEDILKKLTPKKIIAAVVVLFLIWMSMGIYRVNPGSQGVELIFGKLTTTTLAGLHYNLPEPMGRTIEVAVEKVRRVDVGYRSRAANLGNDLDANNIIDVEDESLILTKDENIVDTDFTVFWKVGDPYKFLFNIRKPEQTVKIAAESAMREVVGQSSFDDAVTVGRQEIETKTLELLQEILDLYDSGILVEQVELQKSDPPADVIDAFNDVQRARQDKDRLRNEALSYANSIIPKARGESEKIVFEAEGFKEKAIKESEGEAIEFTKIYKEYVKSPTVVRQRIYLDTMAEIYGKLDKVIIDRGANGVLPYLKLPSIEKKGEK